MLTQPVRHPEFHWSIIDEGIRHTASRVLLILGDKRVIMGHIGINLTTDTITIIGNGSHIWDEEAGVWNKHAVIKISVNLSEASPDFYGDQYGTGFVIKMHSEDGNIILSIQDNHPEPYTNTNYMEAKVFVLGWNNRRVDSTQPPIPF